MDYILLALRDLHKDPADDQRLVVVVAADAVLYVPAYQLKQDLTAFKCALNTSKNAHFMYLAQSNRINTIH